MFDLMSLPLPGYSEGCLVHVWGYSKCHSLRSPFPIYIAANK